MAAATQKLSTPERVPNRSANDCSHSVNHCIRPGELVPILCDELLPNTEVSLGALANAVLPNFATEFQGKCDLRLEAFFAPMSVLWDGWKSFEARKNLYDVSRSDLLPEAVPSFIPLKAFSATRLMQAMRFNSSTLYGSSEGISILPYLAYHKVWEDYYRDRRIQKALFMPPDLAGGNQLATLPYTFNSTVVVDGQAAFGNGQKLFDFERRNYDRDYFNTAMLEASLGQMSDVQIESGKFSIQAFRVANAHTELKELLARVDPSYDSISMALFGTTGMREYDTTVYLGSLRKRVYNNGVFVNNLKMQNKESGDIFGTESKNPNISSGLGGSFSVPDATANASLVDNFKARERGYLIVLASIVPMPSYVGGTHRMHMHLKFGDFGLAKLEKTGNQPIYSWELTNQTPDRNGKKFGWTEKYAEYKTLSDYSTPEYMDPAMFGAFVNARVFNPNVELSTDFIQIKESALDDVLATPNVLDGIGRNTRLNVGFVYHKVHPLSDYAIPTLVDTDNHTVGISRGTNRL